MAESLFNASNAVATGTCVVMQDDQIVYAGPIKKAPEIAGTLVLLSADDFDRLKTLVDKQRH